jgi:hypothetical protein
MSEPYNNKETGTSIRVHRPAATLPQSTAAPIFTVSGGDCVVLYLLGEVATTAIQAGAVARVDTITVSGAAGGTATIVCDGVTIAGDTFAATAALTAAAFVTDHAAAFVAGGVTVTQGGVGHTDDIIFTSAVAGTDFTGATSITNTGGAYTGTVVNTTANDTVNVMKLTANPTVGADVDLCTTLNIDTDAIGTMYNITGTLADAMIATTSGAGVVQADGITVAPGTIDLSCSASKTGRIKWTLFYVPVTAGAKIVVV